MNSRAHTRWPVLLLLPWLAGCATPSAVVRPSQRIMEENRIDVADLSQLPPPVTRVMSGDTLRIVRDAQTPAEREEASMYSVRADGRFAYPYAGIIQASGRTPEEIASELAEKLTPIYRYPQVTVNIALAPGNRVYVGGAVRNPASADLAAAMTIEQAIITGGGVLPTADSKHIALLRMDANGLYRVYFSDYKQFLAPAAPRRAVMLQRGDVVFVPKSGVGNAVEWVDVYLNQLLPFSKSIGLSYNLNNGPISVSTH